MKSGWSRLAALLLAIGMLIPAALPAMALGEAIQSGDQSPTPASALSGQCGEGLYYEFDEETGTLRIVGDGDMWDFAGQAPWSDKLDSIRKVVFSKGVTRISGGAFKDCTKLEAVELPETLTAIDTGAFSGCQSLAAVDLSATAVEVIGQSAFDGCASLETVAFPATLTTIDTGAFSGCQSLTAVDLSTTAVEVIGESAFNGCVSLETVALSETVVSVAADCSTAAMA